MSYRLLEYNDRSLCIANRRFRREEKSDVISIKTDITNADDYFEDANKQTMMRDQSIDLIIGSGALTGNVIDNTEVALKVARKCYELLKIGGKMLLAGHTHSLLSREHFLEMGFKVINSFLVGTQNDSICTDVNGYSISLSASFNRQFYILEK